MPQYKAPLNDMKFIFNDLLGAEQHYKNFAEGEEATPDMIDAILTECARFAEERLSPLNQTGDEQGCELVDGNVKTPEVFKEAYQEYVAGDGKACHIQLSTGGRVYPCHWAY